MVEHFTVDVSREGQQTPRLENVLFTLPAHDKRTYLLSLLRLLARQFTEVYTAYEDNWWTEDARQVSGVGALLSNICSDDVFKSLLIEWTTASSGGGIGQSIGLRRAALLVITQDSFTFQEVFSKSLNQFADKLWIRHTPVMRQEGWFNLPFIIGSIFSIRHVWIAAIYTYFHSIYANASECMLMRIDG